MIEKDHTTLHMNHFRNNPYQNDADHDQKNNQVKEFIQHIFLKEKVEIEIKERNDNMYGTNHRTIYIAVSCWTLVEVSVGNCQTITQGNVTTKKEETQPNLLWNHHPINNNNIFDWENGTLKKL